MTSSPRVFEIANNTMFGRERGAFNTAPHGLIVRNNILRAGIRFIDVPDEERDHALAGWRFDHNGLPRGELRIRSATDVLDEPDFLSADPESRDYLRLRSEGAWATGGAGDPWPDYLGALPPGPAPQEGDWFTRLRERWHATDANATVKRAYSPAPAKIVEPPPLEDWLKGRTILTVAQDGSGQFKTIQAALDALWAGQAVEVLDRGPYRETLRLVKPPADIGLFSRHQTEIELGEWKDDPTISPEFLQGHTFLDVLGFRLSGFRLSYQKKERGQGVTYWWSPIGLLIEDCAAYSAPNSDDSNVTVAVCAPLHGATVAKPMVIRDCVFSGGGVQPVGREPASAVFLRNYFRNSTIHTVQRFEELVVRNNVFDENRPTWPFLINNMTSSPRVFEISNNTMVGRERGAFNTAPQGFIVRNNILRAGIRFIDVPDEDRDHALKGWKFDHNGVPREELKIRSTTDVLDQPDFLSTDPKNRDYLRLRAEGAWATGGAGGQWPDYLGALPPGPAPQEGDWFTRLRERWSTTVLDSATRKEAGVAPPAQIGEPPPLEE